MVECPKCGKEQGKPEKSWQYGPKTRKGPQLSVDLYHCSCGKKFRKYTKLEQKKPAKKATKKAEE